MAATNTNNKCSSCGKQAHLRCARCELDLYCSRTCQTTDYPRHKTDVCNSAKKQFQDAVNALLAGECLTSITESEEKGKGLCTIRHVTKGELVAIYPLRQKQSNGFQEKDLVGYPLHPEMVPEKIDASFMNDPYMSPALFSLIQQGQFEECIIAYLLLVYTRPELTTVTSKRKIFKLDKGRYACYFHAHHDLQPGTPLEWAYGPSFWLQYAAAGRLADCSFEVITYLHEFLFRGPNEKSLAERLFQRLEKELPSEIFVPRAVKLSVLNTVSEASETIRGLPQWLQTKQQQHSLMFCIPDPKEGFALLTLVDRSKVSTNTGMVLLQCVLDYVKLAKMILERHTPHDRQKAKDQLLQHFLWITSHLTSAPPPESAKLLVDSVFDN
jgi:hypothetical protein